MPHECNTTNRFAWRDGGVRSSLRGQATICIRVARKGIHPQSSAHSFMCDCRATRHSNPPRPPPRRLPPDLAGLKSARIGRAQFFARGELMSAILIRSTPSADFIAPFSSMDADSSSRVLATSCNAARSSGWCLRQRFTEYVKAIICP